MATTFHTTAVATSTFSSNNNSQTSTLLHNSGMKEMLTTQKEGKEERMSPGASSVSTHVPVEDMQHNFSPSPAYSGAWPQDTQTVFQSGSHSPMITFIPQGSIQSPSLTFIPHPPPNATASSVHSPTLTFMPTQTVATAGTPSSPPMTFFTAGPQSPSSSFFPHTADNNMPTTTTPVSPSLAFIPTPVPTFSLVGPPSVHYPATPASIGPLLYDANSMRPATSPTASLHFFSSQGVESGGGGDPASPGLTAVAEKLQQQLTSQLTAANQQGIGSKGVDGKNCQDNSTVLDSNYQKFINKQLKKTFVSTPSGPLPTFPAMTTLSPQNANPMTTQTNHSMNTFFHSHTAGSSPVPPLPPPVVEPPQPPTSPCFPAQTQPPRLPTGPGQARRSLTSANPMSWSPASEPNPSTHNSPFLPPRSSYVPGELNDLLASNNKSAKERSQKKWKKEPNDSSFSRIPLFPAMLVSPEEFRNPSTFLKVYGDPKCLHDDHQDRSKRQVLVPEEGEDGNWRCAKCGNINYPRRETCRGQKNKPCGTRRDSDGDEIVRRYATKIHNLYKRHFPQPEKGQTSQYYWAQRFVDEERARVEMNGVQPPIGSPQISSHKSGLDISSTDFLPSGGYLGPPSVDVCSPPMMIS